MRKLVIFLILSIFLVNVNAALDVGFTDGEAVVEIVQPTIPENVSAQNVNNSQYFQGYTPSTLRDFFQETYDALYSEIKWGYNQSLATYNMWNDIWSLKTSLENVAWVNETNTFTQPQTFQNITIDTKIESTVNSTVCWKFKANGDIGVSVIC